MKSNSSITISPDAKSSILNHCNEHEDVIKMNKKLIKKYYNIIEQLNNLIHEKEIEMNEYGKEYFKNSINETFFDISKHPIKLTMRKMYIQQIHNLINEYQKQMDKFISYVPKACTISTD